ncbi:MAG: hypothetical protein CSYNP_02426 [Syntrophus sp. SKADARSKE-3]|nr:hypothetical protein [Syntrophus sp. SKADARSKE-3]
MKTTKKVILVFGITLIFFALLTTWLLAPKEYWSNMEKINFGAVAGGSALVYIAQERRFFEGRTVLISRSRTTRRVWHLAMPY